MIGFPGRHAWVASQRRKFLTRYGGGAQAAYLAGLAGILASGRAPSFAQGTALHWLRVNDFVPASDVRKELLPKAEKGTGAQDQP